MEKLNVFVSSTCFDLSQIRIDLRNSIELNGHSAILSEFPDFPINPAKNTLDNCIASVNNHADVFVLIIGNRYGSNVDSGKSITNTEFLTAKRKGIPIYIFIKKSMLNVLPIWQKNKTGDFSEFVDTPKIFEFISELRDDNKLWTFEFESAQNIVSILNTQFSYLFKDCLKIKTRFDSSIDEFFQNKLSTKALRILIEKESIYELEFFSQTLIDELLKKEDIKNDYEYRIILDSSNLIIGAEKLLDWMGHRTNILIKIINSLNSLISTAFKKYFGEPGVPSDLKGLLYVSQTYARIFERLILWASETTSAKVEDEYSEIKNKLSNLSRKAIGQMWDYQNILSGSVKEIKSRILAGDENIKLATHITIDFHEDDWKEYYIEFEKFKSKVFNP